MPRIVFLLSFFICVNLHSQSLSSEALARELCPPHFSERQKVEAIFNWIANNISYNVRQHRMKNPMDEPEDELPGELRPLNHRVAEKVLQRKQAVCDGYARLFKTLCDHAGIRSEHITGYARTTQSRSGERFRTNHSWNAVFIDSSWHLLDVTWASGYITRRQDEFIRYFDNTYFLTPPTRFIQDHYPEDPKWTLLNDAPLLKEFDQSPYKYGAFITSRINSFSPSRGIITASVGDTIMFTVSTDIKQGSSRNVMMVSDSVLTDPPEDADRIGIWGQQEIKFPYVVTGNSEWIFVTWNGQPVMRYRLFLMDKKIAFNKENQQSD